MLPPTTVETEAISSVKEKMDTLINVRRFTHDELARYNPNFDLFQVPDFLEEMACILLFLAHALQTGRRVGILKLTGSKLRSIS